MSRNDWTKMNEVQLADYVRGLSEEGVYKELASLSINQRQATTLLTEIPEYRWNSVLKSEFHLIVARQKYAKMLLTKLKK